MNTSDVISKAQKKVADMTEMVVSNRAKANEDNFKDEHWFSVVSGEVQKTLEYLMDDLEGAKADVLEMERLLYADSGRYYEDEPKEEFGYKLK